MRKILSYGTADQMLSAFEQRIAVLEDSQDASVQSATSVKGGTRRSNFSRGTADQMLEAFESKIVELEGSDVESATDITAGVVKKNNYVEVESNRDNADSFVSVLVDAVNEELEELDIFDSWTWEQQNSELILTTVTDSDVQEYTIPYADLQMDESNPEEDVQYIMKAITTDDTDEVTSATKIEASDKSVVIPASAKTQYYQDIGGGFGDTDEVYSLEDLMIIWNSECNSDPTMSQYESFDDWWQDTKQWMKPSSKPAEEVDDEMFTDNDGVFGNPGDIISKRDMRAYYEENCDSDPSLMDYNSFEDWWSATSSMLSPVTNSTSVESSDDFAYDWEINGTFEKIASKQVPDSDGFYTDYTMYRNVETSEYVFVFGDNDYYSPEDGNYDYECDSEEEAWEWYNSYNGFDDEDSIYSSTKVVASEELTPEGFYEFFSVSAEPELMDKAAKILYEWYSNEGEEYMPEYVDILDMCDAADDETEKRIVLEAMGEETYDWNDEDVDDDICSAEDVSTDNDAVIEWFDDASASVMDADWTADGEIIVSLDHNVQDIETTAAELISCIEPNGYHVSDWNVNGHNVFIFEVISNDEYAELAADHSYILEDDDIYSATALYQNPYDEEGGDVECATIADNGEQVFQLMEYNSDPEAGIEGDDFYCYGEFFATDEDDALKQLEEAKSAYPEFANLADQARLFVQPYNEHFSTGGEIYQNVSAIAQHLNQDFS